MPNIREAIQQKDGGRELVFALKRIGRDSEENSERPEAYIAGYYEATIPDEYDDE